MRKLSVLVFQNSSSNLFAMRVLRQFLKTTIICGLSSTAVLRTARATLGLIITPGIYFMCM